ncbi:MAG TPA: hypothetical protein VGH87_26310 [Polyangiaceae bacterium]|jgi:hypothetical protein
MTTTGSTERFMRPILDFSIPIVGDRDGRTKGDAIQIGNDYSPGKCDIRNPSSPRKWDKRTGWGLTGATLIYIGDDLSEFSVDIYLWTQPQQTDFDEFYSKWLNKPYRTPNFAGTQSAASLKANSIAQQQLINNARAGLARPDLTDDQRAALAEQQRSALQTLQSQQAAVLNFPPQPKADGSARRHSRGDHRRRGARLRRCHSLSAGLESRSAGTDARDRRLVSADRVARFDAWPGELTQTQIRRARRRRASHSSRVERHVKEGLASATNAPRP